MKSTVFTSLINEWYATHRRELPWRNIKDPYRIWISEIILQQTRIAQGYDYYLRFLEKFPTLTDLAKAQEDEVLKAWEGLGYYSRARNLFAAAQWMEAHGGFPKTHEGVRALKGVGDYTAAAICSFAYNMPVATVDGNVYRVLSRIWGIDEPIDTTSGKKVFQQKAEELLDRNNPADYNQALMDFGATQCIPIRPDCTQCPFQKDCVANRSQTIELLPVKSHKMIRKERYLSYIFVCQKNNVLIHRRNNKDIWKGLYEPYLLETTETEFNKLPNDELTDQWIGIGGKIRILKTNVKHILTHINIHANFYLIEIPNNVTNDVNHIIPQGYTFHPINKIQELAFPTLIKQVLNKEGSCIFERL